MTQRDNPIPSTELDHANLVTVARRQCEASASVLVSVLQDEGIRAIATGGYTAGFRAEAPGVIRVLTFEADADRAREIIHEIEAEIRESQQRGKEGFQWLDGESI